MIKSIRIVVAAALISKDKKILIAQRPKGKSMEDFWEFPGGKLEPGESPEQALVRELNEELGVIVLEKDLKPLTFASHIYDDFYLLLPLYICKNWHGSLSGKEGQNIAFVTKQELLNYHFLPSNIKMLHQIIDFED